MRSLRHSWVMVIPVSLMMSMGCDDAPAPVVHVDTEEHAHEHDHDHGPESLKDAIKELTSLRDTMRDAFAKNDPDGAHDPLHEVGHVLEAIPELAKKEGVSAENQTAIETGVNSLMDAFGSVDKKMHGQEGSTYAEQSAAIDAALLALAAACGGDTVPVTADPAAESTSAPAVETPAPAETIPAPAAEASPEPPKAGN